MPKFEELEKWMRAAYGTQEALADALGIQQGRVSKWIRGAEGITKDYRERLKGLGYAGSFPSRPSTLVGLMAESSLKEESPRYVVEGSELYREVGKLEGMIELQSRRIDRLNEALEKALELIRDLDQRVRAADRKHGKAG